MGKVKKIEKIAPAMYERHCKNCEELVAAGKNYCGNCGAKWIENRITLRNVAADFSDMYLGFDTKFVRTFVDLYRKPESVIKGYIDGRRNHYVDAIRYTLTAVFFSGLYALYLNKTGVFDQILDDSASFYGSIPQSDDSQQFQEEYRKFFTENFFDYQGLIYFLSIPLLALIGRITFWGKKFYNFTEQIVFYMYTYSHYSLTTTPLFLVLLFISPEVVSTGSTIAMLLAFVYVAYAYKRCFKLTIGQATLRTLMSLLVMVGLSLVFFILAIVVTLLVMIVLKYTT